MEKKVHEITNMVLPLGENEIYRIIFNSLTQSYTLWFSKDLMTHFDETKQNPKVHNWGFNETLISSSSKFQRYESEKASNKTRQEYSINVHKNIRENLKILFTT